MNASQKEKYAALRDILHEHSKVAVAFSGGVDSTLLLDVAHDVLGANAVALTAVFSCFPQRERQAAHSFCAERGIRQLELPLDVFAIAGFEDNPPNRCYLCKRTLMSLLLDAAQTEGSSVLVEGTNLDDESDYRPGLAALEELNVFSPLRLAGLTKEDVRAFSKERGLPTWDKPACSCLATRLPYNTRLTPQLMARIDKAEDLVLNAGAKQVRARVHGDAVCIEVDKESIPLLSEQVLWKQLKAGIKELGFEGATLDPQGYRTGSMNTSLPQ